MGQATIYGIYWSITSWISWLIYDYMYIYIIFIYKRHTWNWNHSLAEMHIQVLGLGTMRKTGWTMTCQHCWCEPGHLGHLAFDPLPCWQMFRMTWLRSPCWTIATGQHWGMWNCSRPGSPQMGFHSLWIFSGSMYTNSTAHPECRCPANQSTLSGVSTSYNQHQLT